MYLCSLTALGSASGPRREASELREMQRDLLEVARDKLRRHVVSRNVPESV